MDEVEFFSYVLSWSFYNHKNYFLFDDIIKPTGEIIEDALFLIVCLIGGGGINFFEIDFDLLDYLVR